MISIRKYKTADAIKLHELFHDTVHKININDYSQKQVDAWSPYEFDPEAWQIKMDLMSPFIAEIDGKIVGYADLRKDGLIDHFFCHSNYQGHGVGRCLIEHIFNYGQSIGVSEYRANVSITARLFFEKFGFSVKREQVVDVRGQKFTNLAMIKFS